MGLLHRILNYFRGSVGEAKIAFKLEILDFFGHKGMCLRNIYVPRYDGSTSEIDLLYITTKGFFVIESKNYSGYIFGDDKSQNWTSVLYAGRTWYGRKKLIKNHFYNPIKQNYSHIMALKSYLGSIKAFSIIVFGDQCVLKDITLSSPGNNICNASKLNKTLRIIWESEPDIYTDQQVSAFYEKLSPLTNADITVKTKHIQDIHYGNANMVCPWCGGNLVLRTAKKGQYIGRSFYGCSNYPKCKYTRNT